MPGTGQGTGEAFGLIFWRPGYNRSAAAGDRLSSHRTQGRRPIPELTALQCLIDNPE